MLCLGRKLHCSAISQLGGYIWTRCYLEQNIGIKVRIEVRMVILRGDLSTLSICPAKYKSDELPRIYNMQAGISQKPSINRSS